jgi:lipopolysaccharide export system protein LptA
MGLYTGNVHARHPQMVIDCDELEIHMKKQPEGASVKKKPVAAADTDILAGPGAKKKSGSPADSGIKMAYARGSMVTIEKRTEEGQLQIAHCNEVATYDGSTGDITLRGMPSVQQGNKLIEASDPRTYMIIDQKGKLTVLGGQQRTTLIDEKAADAALPGAPANEAPPATPAPQQR